jgi:uncharacterized membrane protein SirB2
VTVVRAPSSAAQSQVGWWAAPEWLRKTVAIVLGLVAVIFIARASKFGDKWITYALLLVALYLVLHNAPMLANLFASLGQSIHSAATPHA